MTYYIDTAATAAGGDALNTSGAGYSETTVESTHPGSDDAVAPPLPAHAYGTAPESPAAAIALGTIQEQSTVGGY